MTTGRLQRRMGLGGAVMMGLGAMVGTGVFVSIGVAAGVAGPAVVVSVALAAGVALCNALSSAQLAASHPVSGGTYEYGYQYLNPWLGLAAGWLFLLAKSASAATAALGCAGYLLHETAWPSSFQVPLAAILVALFTGIVWSGIHRSNLANILIVSMTLAALALFVVSGVPSLAGGNLRPLVPMADGVADWGRLFHAGALMFVAYTGYGRVATLGEEVRDPDRTIPRAIVVTMAVSMALYVAVAVVGVGTVGAPALAAATAAEAAPLVVVAERLGRPWVAGVVAVGAITAMLGVLLNLILGLSRVLLAMGRRGDVPARFGRLNREETTPTWAVGAVGVFVASLVLVGDIKTTWSFSAFTVLLYYAITNLAALRLAPEHRRYPRWVAVLGMAACLFLSVWIEGRTWGVGLLLLAGGFGVRAATRRWAAPHGLDSR